MVKSLVDTFSHFLNTVLGYVPPGLSLSLATSAIEDGKYLSSYRHEFVGSLLMIVCTFSAGKWIGSESRNVAWISHALGVITADYLAGGPHVNPSVTMAMYALGKVTYTDAFVRIAAQLGGGLVAFPVFHAISDAMKWTPFGGPEFNMDGDAVADAFLSEYTATLLLMFAIYILNWELHFGKYHYIIKQSLTAFAIRALIEYFPTAGPAMNPMLATTWDVFGVGTVFEYPTDFAHYFVYWIAPFLAAITSAIVYTAYAGGKVFGLRNPVGPIKHPKVKITKKKKN